MITKLQEKFRRDTDIEVRRLIGTQIAEAAASLNRNDAELTAFIPRELEGIIEGVFKRIYATLKARTLVPPIQGLKATDQTIKYNVYDRKGVSQIITSYADDLPRADIIKDEIRSAVRAIGQAYGYNVDELMASALGLVSLDAEKGEACRMSYEEKVDRIISNGDSANGLVGLLNLPNALSFTFAADGTGSSKLWSTKTPDQILRDLNAFYQFMVDQTNDVHRMTRMVLPVTQFGLIENTPRSSNSDKTILDYFLSTHKNVEVLSWYKLKNAGAGGTIDRMVGFIPDPMFIGYAEPMPFTQYAPQARNLELVVPTMGKTGGVICKYPFTVEYGDGM